MRGYFPYEASVHWNGFQSLCGAQCACVGSTLTPECHHSTKPVRSDTAMLILHEKTVGYLVTSQFHSYFAQINKWFQPDLVHITKCSTTSSCRHKSTLISGVPPLFIFSQFSVLTSTPLLRHSSRSNRALSSQTSAFPVRLTTTRPARVALPVYCVGADTGTVSKRPIQSLAYEIPSSAVIPYTSSAYSHIQDPVSTSCLCEIEGKLGTDKLGVFLLVFKGFLSLELGNLPRGSRTPHTILLRIGGISNET